MVVKQLTTTFWLKNGLFVKIASVEMWAILVPRARRFLVTW